MKSAEKGKLQPEEHHALGVRLAAHGRIAEAIDHFKAAARLEPGNAVRQFNCGRAWQQSGDLLNAVTAYSKAVEIDARFYEAWCNLSAAFRSLRKINDAVAAGQKAVSLKPRSAAAWLHLGNAIKASGDWESAEAAYRKACGFDPTNPRAALNLANTIRETGRLPEAIARLRGIVAHHPKLAEARRDLAFALLIFGHLTEGWLENEWRWETEGLSAQRRALNHDWHADSPAPALDSLSGQRVLVFAEQGFGDAIQFVRYAPLLAERGAKVILECAPALQRLFASVAGVEQLLLRGQPVPPVGFQLPLLSLPRVFGTTVETIPSHVPYLAAPRKATKLPKNDSPGRKVGLVWAGNAKHENDFNRSLPRELVVGLVEQIEGAQLYSLQTGTRAQECKELSQVVDLSPGLTDFAATAELIEQLDLVISVDTSVAHLAGALGKPVWILLPYAPDWRWLLGTDRSRWYPTARLFRQPKPNDWESVFEGVGRAFAKK